MTILKPTWLRRELKPDGTLKINVVAPDGVTTDTHALTITSWLSEAVAAMCGFKPAGHHPPLGDSLREHSAQAPNPLSYCQTLRHAPRPSGHRR